MRRLLSLVALLLVACGEKSEALSSDPPPADVGTASGIQGTLVVHSNYWDIVTDPEEVYGIHVILGDGSRFRQPLGRDGVARFEDAAIQGPQDVSVVVAATTGKTLVDTYLAVNQEEVFLPNYLTPGQGPRIVEQATVTGRVTGLQGGGVAQVHAVGSDLSGYATTKSDGSFSLVVDGVAPGQVSLLAWQASGEGVERVGLLRELSVGGGQTVSGVELALDHEVDQPLPVAVEGWQPYDERVQVRVSYFLGTEYLFDTTVSGTPPLTVPVISRTAPFDTVQVRVAVTSGQFEQLPFGSRSVTVAGEDAASVTVMLPAPLLLDSVPLGTYDAPAEAPLEGFTLRWSVAPAAHVARVNLAPQGDALFWTVTAPASITSFTPFELPAETSLTRRLLPVRYRVDTRSEFLGPTLGYADIFARDAGGSTTGTWRTRVQGYVVLR